MKKVSGFSTFLFAAMIGGFIPNNANALICSGFFAATAMVCGDASVQGNAGGDHLVSSPNPIFSEENAGPVAVGAAGSGSGAVAGAVVASGSFGEAHGSASADNGIFKMPGPFLGNQADVVANAVIGFVDGFTVNAVTRVNITSSLEGVFTGEGLGRATFLLATANLLLIDDNGPLVNRLRPSSAFVYDLTLSPGAYLFAWSMDVHADSGSDQFSVSPSSTADVSHTGHLFFDFLTSDASPTFLSGHDYSSAEALGATPLPGALPLLATGLGGLGLFGWRRKRALH